MKSISRTLRVAIWLFFLGGTASLLLDIAIWSQGKFMITVWPIEVLVGLGLGARRNVARVLALLYVPAKVFIFGGLLAMELGIFPLPEGPGSQAEHSVFAKGLFLTILMLAFGVSLWQFHVLNRKEVVELFEGTNAIGKGTDEA